MVNFLLFYVQSGKGKSQLIIRETQGSWKTECVGCRSLTFTDNNKAVFINAGDSLCIMSLGTNPTAYVKGVNDFKYFKQGKSEWIMYLSTHPEQELIISNLENAKQICYKGVTEYLLHENGKDLIVKNDNR